MRALFGVKNDEPRLVEAAPFQLHYREDDLQRWADSCPGLLNAGVPMLSLGREIPTRRGHFIDNLFVDSTGTLVAAELKRGRTPRDVVAQLVDYAAHVSSLDWEAVERLCQGRWKLPLDIVFESVYGRHLVRAPLKPSHRLLIVAESYDPRVIDAALYMINGGTGLVLLEFHAFPIEGQSLLEVVPVLGEIPPASLTLSGRVPHTTTDGGPEQAYGAWLFPSLAPLLTDIASDQGWLPDLRINKMSLAYRPEHWSLPLADCYMRADIFKKDTLSFRLSFRKELCPGLRDYLQARESEWRSLFPGVFETSAQELRFANLTVDRPQPAIGDAGALASLQTILGGMTAALVPLLDSYFNSMRSSGVPT